MENNSGPQKDIDIIAVGGFFGTVFRSSVSLRDKLSTFQQLDQSGCHHQRHRIETNIFESRMLTTLFFNLLFAPLRCWHSCRMSTFSTKAVNISRGSSPLVIMTGKFYRIMF